MNLSERFKIGIPTIIYVVVLFIGIITSFTIIRTTVSQQEVRVCKLELKTDTFTDRIARVETKIDMVLSILQGRKQ